MRQRIRNERAYELPAEGHRYWDLRRWGIYGPTVKNATDIYGDLMFTREYQPRHELWPIPQVELERNPNLQHDQNPGWKNECRIKCLYERSHRLSYKHLIRHTGRRE